MKRIASLFFLFPLLPLVSAPLSPSEYEKLQKSAPEVLEIEVLKVESRVVPESKEEVIRATVVVLQVEKTASEASPGNFLFVVYSIQQDFEGKPLPGQPPPLQVGEKVPAFLALAEGTTYFRPVAGRMSFRRF